jgi:hypothetical protein
MAEHDDDDRDSRLRTAFAVEWAGTNAQFCTEHGIDPSNFSKWLRGTRSSPASADAVSDYVDRVRGALLIPPDPPKAAEDAGAITAGSATDHSGGAVATEAPDSQTPGEHPEIPVASPETSVSGALAVAEAPPVVQPAGPSASSAPSIVPKTEPTLAESKSPTAEVPGPAEIPTAGIVVGEPCGVCRSSALAEWCTHGNYTSEHPKRRDKHDADAHVGDLADLIGEMSIRTAACPPHNYRESKNGMRIYCTKCGMRVEFGL